MDAVDVAESGREAIRSGELRKLREQFGLSITTQAYMIGVQPAALRAWEAQTSRPSAASAAKVAGWYRQAREASAGLDTLPGEDVSSTDLVHISTASQYLAMAHATIRDLCERGLLECVDLGVLGLYVASHEVNRLKQGA